MAQPEKDTAVGVDPTRGRICMTTQDGLLVFEHIIEGGGLAGLQDDLPTDPIRRFLRWLPDAARDLLRLFIQHPVEFALLFIVFSLLGAPAYLAYRRRTFVG